MLGPDFDEGLGAGSIVLGLDSNDGLVVGLTMLGPII